MALPIFANEFLSSHPLFLQNQVHSMRKSNPWQDNCVWVSSRCLYKQPFDICVFPIRPYWRCTSSVDRMSKRNLVSWTTLISSYSKMGLALDALNCFRFMVGDGFVPNHYTCVSVVSACASLGAERIGKEVHKRIFRCEVELNSFVCNSLVNFYGKCGLLKSAVAVFDAILEPNQVSWTSLLSCACQSGENLEGLKIFLWSQKAGVTVNEFSCASVLGACVALECLEFGMQVHGIAVKCGIRLDQFVVTGLVNLYAKCGALDLARQVFREVDKPHWTAWTALIGGCSHQGKRREAIDLFCELYSLGVKPRHPLSPVKFR